MYSICVSVTAAGIALSEGGVTGVLMSEGPRFKNQRRRFGAVLEAAINFRRLVALVMIIPSSVLMIIMLWRIGTDAPLIVIATVVVVLTMWFSLERSLLQVPLRLDRKYLTIQSASLVSALIRLALIAILVAIGTAGVWQALLVICAATIVELALLRRSVSASKQVAAHPRVRFVVHGRMRLALKRTLPATLTGVLQGQAFLLILSFLSTATIIAEISALSRFSVVYVVFSAFFLDVVAGRFARMERSRSKLARQLVIAIVTYLVLVLLVVCALGFASTPVLAILGPDYVNLAPELVIVSLGSGLIALGNAWKNLNSARNWVSGSWLFIPTTVTWAIVGLLLLDLQNVFIASAWMAGQAAAMLLTQALSTVLGLKAVKR